MAFPRIETAPWADQPNQYWTSSGDAEARDPHPSGEQIASPSTQSFGSHAAPEALLPAALTVPLEQTAEASQTARHSDVPCRSDNRPTTHLRHHRPVPPSHARPR